VKPQKAFFLISALTLGLSPASASLALNPNDLFIQANDLNMLAAHSEFSTPILSSQNEYYFRVTGRYGAGPLDRGDSQADAAFAAYGTPVANWGPLDVRHYPNTLVSVDGQANYRPTPDEYRTDHIYTLMLTPQDRPITVATDDSYPWDNVGGPLHFELYQVSPVPEPSTFLAGALMLVVLGMGTLKQKLG
jgi:hypothetical protein